MKAGRVYASKFGWRVLPVRTLGKIPLLADWPRAASADVAVIAEWEKLYTDCNIGIACGSGSGFFALDVDPRHGGDGALAELTAEHGPLPLTTEAATPSGGSHYLFAMPDHGVTNSAGTVGAGLDIRGDGGQIVVAPSSTAAGSYRWVHPPWEVPPAPAPTWLLARLTRAPTASPDEPSAPSARGYFPPATDADLAEAREALESHGPAIDGQGGGLHTCHAASLLTHDHALELHEAWPLFVEWNLSNEPPWALDGGTPSAPDLRMMLARGAKYGKLAYGCKRTLDIRAVSKRAAEAWSAAGGKDDDLLGLLQPIREMIRTRADPLVRDMIQQDLMATTGKGALALGLPRGHVRAEPKARKATGDALEFDASSTGVPLDNLNNAVIVIERQKRAIWFDEFYQQIRTPNGEWTDAEDLALAFEMQRVIGLKKMQTKTVHEAVLAHARREIRDSVCDWLGSLTWDGQHRIGQFLVRAFGTEDNEYTRSASTNFWRSMVARALRPGAKVDNMLVLEGVQGLKKSSALQAIVGSDLFAESASDPKDKDFFIALTGKMIVEVAELDSFSRASVTAVKRVLTCQVDRYRPPYGRAAENFPRRGIFVGTTNRSDWNSDDTGARRFWPVWCTSIDLDLIRRHREQLFAEAVADVNAGEGWWEMPAEATLAAQEERRQIDPWEELLETYVNGEGAAAVADGVTLTNLMETALGVPRDRMGKVEQMRATRILKNLGFERVDGWLKGAKQKYWKRVAVVTEQPFG